MANKSNMLLVSVPVITYNSAGTIIETLESIKAQTYPNLELIISDDFSKDDTVDLCRKWVEKNKERFVRTEIITVEKNTGVAGNLNRAVNACQSDWIKSIAGDDQLMENCVADNVEYIRKHPEISHVFSRMKPFGEIQEWCKVFEEDEYYSFFKKTPNEQYDYLLFVQNCVPGPTIFYNKKYEESLGISNDERIPLLEDRPRWINLLKAGVKFGFIDKETVRYRISGNSLSNAHQTNVRYTKSSALFYLYYQHEEFWKKDKLLALKKYINAKKQLNDNLFWKIANRGIKAIYKRVRHEQE